MRALRLSSLRFASLVVLVFFASNALWPASPVTKDVAQETAETKSEETVVNLAAGRVLVAVTKGAILVGTVEDPIEVDTHPPIPVQIGSSRVGVILGAVEWIAPDSRQQLARLDQELPRLRGREGETAPHLGTQAGREATDLEAVGDGLFDRLSDLVRHLHGKIDLPSGQPIAILIVADYLEGYGPEVWRLDYGIEQDEESPGYWITKALPPTYAQCWPPEKGQPRALLEFAYPPTANGCAEFAPSASPAHGDVRYAPGILEGDSSKVPTAEAIQSVRAALDAISGLKTRETMAALGEESGFKWILAPPVETAKPSLRTNRPADAPSLAAPRPSLAK